jgi:hypothetical protein
MLVASSREEQLSRLTQFALNDSAFDQPFDWMCQDLLGANLD